MSSVRMRPYGIRSEYRDDAYGPTTKFSGSMSQRRKYRRKMHRQVRIDGRAEVEQQVNDLTESEAPHHGTWCECPECDHWLWWWRNGEPERVELPKTQPSPSFLGAEIAKALLGITL